MRNSYNSTAKYKQTKIKKEQRAWNWSFEEDMQKPTGAWKVLNLTNIRYMKTQTMRTYMVSYHLTHVKIAIIKKTKDNSVSEDLEKRKSLYTVDGNAICCNHYEKTVCTFLKTLNIALLYDPEIPSLVV